MPLKLKTRELEDGTTVAEIKDGHPVYIDEDDNDRELAMDVPSMRTKIIGLSKDEKGHREAREEAEKRLKAFEGIEDPEAAKKALEKVAALNDKELIDAGKVEEIKANAVKATEEKMQAALDAKDEEIAELSTNLDGATKTLNDELIGGAFARSKFVEDNIAIPVDFLQAKFGNNFKVVDGKRVGFDENGKEIYSKSKPGEIAEFDEALEILVSAHPNKDDFLKGRQKNGSGAEPPGGKPKGRVVSRADFDAMGDAQKRQVITDGVQIVDAR